MGPVPWLIGGEIFPEESRSVAMSIGASLNWVCAFLISIGFPVMNKALKQYTFLPFVALLVLLVYFIFRYVPETKGKSVVELLHEFASKGGYKIAQQMHDSV